MPILILSLFVFISYWTLTTLQLKEFANDPGVGWHLMTGDWIIQRGEVPLFDPFLASPEPRRWIADQWLSDLIFGFLLRVSRGEHGLAILFGVLTGLFLFTFSALVFGAVERRTKSPLVAGLAAFVSLKLASVQFVLRPVVFGIALFALMNLLLWRIIDRVRSEQPLRFFDVVPLLLLTVLWANLHPSFGLGIVLLGLAIVGLFIDAVIIEQKFLQRRSFVVLGATLILMLAVSLLNPNGWRLLHQIASLVGNDFFMNLNEEWRPINVRSHDGERFILTLGVILVGSYLAAKKREQPSVTEPLIVGFFAWSALSSVRFLPYYAIVSAPFFAQGLSRVLVAAPLIRIPIYRRIGALVRSIDKTARKQLRWYGGIVAVVALFPVLSVVLLGAVYPYQGPFEQSRSEYPYEAVEALEAIVAQEAGAEPITVCATPDWGGFLAFQGKGRIKPIIDDRNSLLGEKFYREYFESVSVRGDITSFLKKASARFLLLRTGDPLAMYLRDTGKLPERWRGRGTVLFETHD